MNFCSRCQRSTTLCLCPKPRPKRAGITVRQYQMECASCHGSGLSVRRLERPVPTTTTEPCKGCEGAGYVTVTETTIGGAS